MNAITTNRISNTYIEKSQLKLSDFSIDITEIYRSLGYMDSIPETQFIEIIDATLELLTSICKPRIGYRIYEGNFTVEGSIEINNIQLKAGRNIIKYFSKATQFVVFIVTAGIEFDNYMKKLRFENDTVTEFIADAIGSEIAQAGIRNLSKDINAIAQQTGLKISNPYSPGYCNWDLSEQQTLFSLLPAEPCGVRLNDSSLMYPVKSVSGVIGIGFDLAKMPHKCNVCNMKNCSKRIIIKAV